MAAAIELATTQPDYPGYDDVAPLIAGAPQGKNLLSIQQFNKDDLISYIEDTRAAERLLRDPSRGGMPLLPFTVLKAIMKQPSTRTGGSMTTAMAKLGGQGDLISGMQSSSEAKGESPEHTWVAFATQADIIGLRSKEEDGPYVAARAIAESLNYGKLWQEVPVINLGNGTDEHPTQTIGDIATIAAWLEYDYKAMKGLTLVTVGDHERYRAFHSLYYAAKRLGMKVLAVESEAAPMPAGFIQELGPQLERTDDLDEALRAADVFYPGRNPDEYDGKDPFEQERSRALKASYASWVVDYQRLQQMKPYPGSIGMHARPINGELTRDVEQDPRMQDVPQMARMIAGRMAVLANHRGIPEHWGKSFRNAVTHYMAYPGAARVPTPRVR